MAIYDSGEYEDGSVSATDCKGLCLTGRHLALLLFSSFVLGTLVGACIALLVR